MCVSKQHNTAFLIDVAAPGDNRFVQKVNEKCDKLSSVKSICNSQYLKIPIFLKSFFKFKACSEVLL